MASKKAPAPNTKPEKKRYSTYEERQALHKEIKIFREQLNHVTIPACVVNGSYQKAVDFKRTITLIENDQFSRVEPRPGCTKPRLLGIRNRLEDYCTRLKTA